MLLQQPGGPLDAIEVPDPRPGPGQVLVRVTACAVCRTDLHVLDGDLTHPKLPLILGHEIVGQVVEQGKGSQSLSIGQRVGIPWLGWSCGKCPYCQSTRENLCSEARFTGYTLNGGFAEFAVADHRFCFALPDSYSDTEAAPLLCAGLIGYRSLVQAGEAKRLGIYGFGAAAHIVIQLALHQGRHVFAFTREGDREGQEFARRMGAVWSGPSDQAPPEELDAAILFAPVGTLIPVALKAVAPGGVVVCGGIHMSDIPSFPYSLLWGERKLSSVANLTRQDGVDFLRLAPEIPIRTQIEEFQLAEANTALKRLREGSLQGTAVLQISP